MERTAVVSSNVKSVGYNAEALELEVEFNNGTIYRYAPVGTDIYDDLCFAESVGRFVNGLKKDPTITCTRVEDEAVA